MLLFEIWFYCKSKLLVPYQINIYFLCIAYDLLVNIAKLPRILNNKFLFYILIF